MIAHAARRVRTTRQARTGWGHPPAPPDAPVPMTGTAAPHDLAQPTPPPPSVPARVRSAYGVQQPADSTAVADTVSGKVPDNIRDTDAADGPATARAEILSPIYERRGDRPVVGRVWADRVGRALDLRA